MIFLDIGSVEDVGFKAIFTLVGSLIGILAILAGLIILNFKRQVTSKKGSLYSKEPLILGVDVARSLAVLVEDFMVSQPQPENAPFELSTAAICRGTGRIFPDCVDATEVIRLDWSFLPKRYKGTYASWGALSEDEQVRIKLIHVNELEGYQTEESSKHISPTDVEDYFKEISPGPLYVDRMKGTLIGWKCVPGTHFEVLVVQLPKFKSIEESL